MAGADFSRRRIFSIIVCVDGPYFSSNGTEREVGPVDLATGHGVALGLMR